MVQQLYRSATTGHAPANSNLVFGQLALNYYDGLLFYLDQDGSTVRSGRIRDALSFSYTATLGVGYTFTPNNIGTKSSGSYAPDPTLGNFQYATNNGAHQINAPSADCVMDILYTNGASAGALTFSGYTVGSNTGDPYGTVNTNKYILQLRRINGTATYAWKALV